MTREQFLDIAGDCEACMEELGSWIIKWYEVDHGAGVPPCQSALARESWRDLRRAVQGWLQAAEAAGWQPSNPHMGGPYQWDWDGAEEVLDILIDVIACGGFGISVSAMAPTYQREAVDGVRNSFRALWWEAEERVDGKEEVWDD